MKIIFIIAAISFATSCTTDKSILLNNTLICKDGSAYKLKSHIEDVMLVEKQDDLVCHNSTEFKFKTKLINIRVTEKEKRAMQNLANKHTDGNLSEWIKMAAQNYKPEKKK